MTADKEKRSVSSTMNIKISRQQAFATLMCRTHAAIDISTLSAAFTSINCHKKFSGFSFLFLLHPDLGATTIATLAQDSTPGQQTAHVKCSIFN